MSIGRWYGLVSRAGGFFFCTLLSAVASLVSVPILLRAIGSTQWAGLALGMSIGSIAGIFVAWGWGIVGPGSVARDPSCALDRYCESLLPRLLLLLPSTGVACLISMLVGGTRWTSTATIASSTAVYGLAAPWYFIGMADPKRLLLLDVLPRAGATILGAVWVLRSPSPDLYAFVQLLGTLGCVALSHLGIVGLGAHRRMSSALGRKSLSFRRALRLLQENASAVGTSLVSSGYLAAPMIIVSWLRPEAAPVFALGDRLLKWSVTGLAPVTQVLQGWIPRNGLLRERATRGLACAGGVGVFCGAVLGSFGPVASGVLSHGEISIPATGCWAVAVAVACTTLTRVSGPGILAPLDRTRDMFFSAVLAAVVGLSMLVAAIDYFGAVGALWSVALAELVVLIYQVVAMVRELRI